MSQTAEIAIPDIRYTRTDLAAFRAFLSRIPMPVIVDLYYSESSREADGVGENDNIEQRLIVLRSTLIQKALIFNPGIAEALRVAKTSGAWSSKLTSFLVECGEKEMLPPQLNDHLSMWMKKTVVLALAGDGLQTIGDLVFAMKVRGKGWWRPIPRVGAKRALAMAKWMAAHCPDLELPASCFDNEPDLVEGPIVQIVPMDDGNRLQRMAPLDRIGLPAQLNGSNGINRHPVFPMISARNDKEAIEDYLYKFRDQPPTMRSYRKELERFLLWCIAEQGIAMSSVMQDDCESYKDFLKSIVPPDIKKPETITAWVGNRTFRLSEDWKPFASELSPRSQKYAFVVIKSFFDWLVDVRYLSANPWKTVSAPREITGKPTMDVEKAIPDALWRKLTDTNGIIDQLCETDARDLVRRYRLGGTAAAYDYAAQFRLVRATLLLSGESGMRRNEIVTSTRDIVRPVHGKTGLWEMNIIGKGDKLRRVYFGQRAMSAILSHWMDRKLNFDALRFEQIPLLSPVSLAPISRVNAKHKGEGGAMMERGFSADGLYQMLVSSLKRIAADETIALSPEDRDILAGCGVHSLRHTFGTRAAKGMPLNVLQGLMGHASLQTTTLYVQAERSVAENEALKFLA